MLEGWLAEVERRGDICLLRQTEVGVVSPMNGELPVLRVGEVRAVRVSLGEREGEVVRRFGFKRWMAAVRGNGGGQDFWGRAAVLERNGRVDVHRVVSTDVMIRSFVVRGRLAWVWLFLSCPLLPPRLLGELVVWCCCHAHFVLRRDFDFLPFLLPGDPLLPLHLLLLGGCFLPPHTVYFWSSLLLLKLLFLTGRVS